MKCCNRLCRRIGTVLLSSVLLALGAQAPSAQEKYPTRPIKVIVPYAPGGATDIVARIIGDEVQKITGQGFVVINKPGANGILAIDELAKSAPDGYTLMLGNVSTNAITPIIYASKMPVDYKKSVLAVTRLVDVPAFLVATDANNFPPKTVKDFVSYAKANPGKMHYGTVGVGSYPHYDMAYFLKRAGDLNVMSLPNKNGASGVIQDLLRGDAQAAFLNVASSGPQVQAGKLRALAVVNYTRLKEYPDIPTMQEAGYADVGTVAWQALFAPAGTPTPVLETLFHAITVALERPETIEKFKAQYFNVVPNKSLAEAHRWLADEIAHWEKITSAVKIEVQ
ncbi:tripartite tricarboxylate transporter substrate binding protein [Microbacteriaceae bacterium K1510]|nr:tripartite tricarboxylate transporter substrate binding protein [Microbacteriaceae bacterium K1510]